MSVEEKRGCVGRTHVVMVRNKITHEEKEKVAECRGTIERRIYAKGWYVENCDTCNHYTTGFLRNEVR